MLTRRQQQQKKQEKLREQARIAKLAKELGRNPDGSVTKVKKKSDKTLSVPFVPPSPPDFPSLTAVPEKAEGLDTFPVEGYEEREAAAQIEINKKKNRVGPLYPKGGYQYMTDDTDTTTLSGKV